MYTRVSVAAKKPTQRLKRELAQERVNIGRVSPNCEYAC